MTETVLFLCPHGAAKSVLAAALLQRLAEERGLPLQATCAGTEPDPMIAPHVSTLLAQEGLPSQDLQGAYVRIQQHLTEWIAAYGFCRRARRPIEGGER